MRKLLNSELNRKTVAEYQRAEKTPIVLVLDNVRSCNNIGSAFRTSDCFLLQAVYLCGISSTPPNAEIHKTALGATESVAWKYFGETLEAVNELKTNGYIVVSVEQAENSVWLHDMPVDENSKYALVFGNEIRGVEQEVVNQSDWVLEIPQFGTKHSFNIAVSVGIVLWEFFRKMRGNE